MLEDVDAEAETWTLRGTCTKTLHFSSTRSDRLRYENENSGAPRVLAAVVVVWRSNNLDVIIIMVCVLCTSIEPVYYISLSSFRHFPSCFVLSSPVIIFYSAYFSSRFFYKDIYLRMST